MGNSPCNEKCHKMLIDIDETTGLCTVITATKTVFMAKIDYDKNYQYSCLDDDW